MHHTTPLNVVASPAGDDSARRCAERKTNARGGLRWCHSFRKSVCFSMCAGSASWCHFSAKTLAISTNGSIRSESRPAGHKYSEAGRSLFGPAGLAIENTVSRSVRDHGRKSAGDLSARGIRAAPASRFEPSGRRARRDLVRAAIRSAARRARHRRVASRRCSRCLAWRDAGRSSIIAGRCHLQNDYKPALGQARPCCGAGGRPSRGAILRALNKKSPTIRAAGQDFHRLLGASLCAGARFLQANGGPRPCRPSAYPIPSSTP
jgi:hypothetical protein